MSHMIDQTTGRAAIAFVGETPWHGLGQELQAGADVATWRKQAGLDFRVLRSPVSYATGDGQFHPVKNRDVLYRNDTGADLGVVSRSGYKVHQPREVLDFFGDITSAGGFELETAGALSGGSRIWALAKVGPGANVIGQDRVAPYLLLATSFDGSLCTIAKFTSIRVVCHNTISMALTVPATANHSSHTVSSLRLPHRSDFDAQAIRDQLGIVHGAFAEFLGEAHLLAEKGVSDKQAADLVASVYGANAPAAQPGVAFDITKNKGYKRILDLFNGKAIGSDLTGGKNAWALLNAATQFVDHERGKTRDSGLNAAWFGAGDVLKTEFKEALLAL